MSETSTETVPEMTEVPASTMPRATGSAIPPEELERLTQDIIAALKQRFSDIVGPETKDICYATQNRQSAVRELSKIVDVILVVGAQNSSNSNRLREIGAEAGIPSYLIASGAELDPAWLGNAGAVGITAGASAPEELVEDVIEALHRAGPVQLSVLPGIEEDIRFRLPGGLIDT